MSTALPPEPGGSPMLPAVARVRARRRETHDIWTLEIDPGEVGPGGLAFQPGQFNMLYAFGLGEVPISISSDPAKPHRLLHTVRAVGPVSQAITALRAKDALGLRGPFGSAWPVGECEGADLVIVAGGLGLAPLRPAIYRVFANRERYGKIAVLYGTRSPEDILFRREIERWRRRLDADIDVTVDHAAPDWRGNVGVVTKLIDRADFDPARATALVCGPEIMMRFTATALIAAGLAEERIHLSMERNMKCAVGHCGHCQFGPTFICKDGPVMRYDRIAPLLTLREI